MCAYQSECRLNFATHIVVIAVITVIIIIIIAIAIGVSLHSFLRGLFFPRQTPWQAAMLRAMNCALPQTDVINSIEPVAFHSNLFPLLFYSFVNNFSDLSFLIITFLPSISIFRFYSLSLCNNSFKFSSVSDIIMTAYALKERQRGDEHMNSRDRSTNEIDIHTLTHIQNVKRNTQNLFRNIDAFCVMSRFDSTWNSFSTYTPVSQSKPKMSFKLNFDMIRMLNIEHDIPRMELNKKK